jgi:amidase
MPSAAAVYMVAAMLLSLTTGLLGVVPDAAAAGKFHLQEATIADIHRAILSREITSTELVKLYLNRIKAYNGTCVKEPQGILGPIETIPHAGQINALSSFGGTFCKPYDTERIRTDI